MSDTSVRKRAAPKSKEEKRVFRTGGFSLSKEEIEAQREKNRAWIKREESEREELRKQLAQDQEKRADSALKFVILIWIIIIIGIFYHVFNTIRVGMSQNASRHSSFDSRNAPFKRADDL